MRRRLCIRSYDRGVAARSNREEHWLASPILVTGGTGRLGRLVVQRLGEAGSSVRVLARQGRDVAAGVEFVRSDLRLGSGLDAAVAGASVIVHCATSTKGDVEAMQNLVGAANQTGLPHLVYVSIVGIDAIASWGYPKSKLQAEAVLVNSELPWTILRATQFHEYVLAGLQKLVRSPVVPVPAGFRVQPVDTAAVARRLVELALEAPSGRVPELAGPDITDWEQMLRDYLRISGRHRSVVPVRIPGTRVVRAGGLLPAPGHTVAGRGWQQFLVASQAE